MQTVAIESPPAVDYAAIKGRQQAAWSAGNYAVVGTTLQIVGESLCEALDVRAGQRVLDVAAGNGNATLAAARRGCDVVCRISRPSTAPRRYSVSPGFRCAPRFRWMSPRRVSASTISVRRPSSAKAIPKFVVTKLFPSPAPELVIVITIGPAEPY